MLQERTDSIAADGGKNGEGTRRPRPLIDPITKRCIPTYREWFNRKFRLDIPTPQKRGSAAGSETK